MNIEFFFQNLIMVLVYVLLELIICLTIALTVWVLYFLLVYPDQYIPRIKQFIKKALRITGK